MKWPLSSRVDLCNDRISTEDSDRQRRTAEEILCRLERQPGVILADEVGMGKTFVALSVAVSVIEATKRQVVVLVPPSVQRKWPQEWKVFQEVCLVPGGRRIRGAPDTVNNATDLLRRLDEPADRRHHLIFATHGAFDRSLTDPWLQLALVHRAFYKRPSLTALKTPFAQRAASIIRYQPFKDERLVSKLLATPLSQWSNVVDGFEPGLLDDDPVPHALLGPLARLDPSPLVEALRGVPQKNSKHHADRLDAVRVAIRLQRDEVWKAVLADMTLRLPLLILDEAHHAKNPGTKLAKQLSQADDERERGALAGSFDRMLFLTATPFQLGHHELIRVLDRFDGVRWSTQAARREFTEQRQELGAALDGSQMAALRFQSAWARVSAEDVASAPTEWWNGTDRVSLPDALRRALEAHDATAERFDHVKALMQPWVIRHLKGDLQVRRNYRAGQQVQQPDAPATGIEVTGDAVLPFLLAARAQGLVASRPVASAAATRALFAEGLSSSFEAYRETRSAAGDILDDEASGTADETVTETSPEVGWYLERIDEALPRDGVGWEAHPKLATTVGLATELWERREKLLVFCFFIATGRALRRHIGRAIWHRTLALGAEGLRVDPTDTATVDRRLRLLADRFFAPNSSLVRSSRQKLADLVKPAGLDDATHSHLIDVAARFLRTPSFLVRYVLLEEDAFGDAVLAALSATDDDAHLAHRIGDFAQQLAGRIDEERTSILSALDELVTGVRPAQDPYESGESRVGDVWIPDVRLANGATRRDLRERLMLAFNAPFLPDVLVTSAVLGEGVDLHRDCRHVIHHDGDWNPSVLEQRTGRVDRIGGLAERTGQPVVVYEPYLAGAQDEKQYKVVKDRDAWFNIVMGAPMSLDEASTESAAARVPIPAALADRLRLDLSVVAPNAS